MCCGSIRTVGVRGACGTDACGAGTRAAALESAVADMNFLCSEFQDWGRLDRPATRLANIGAAVQISLHRKLRQHVTRKLNLNEQQPRAELEQLFLSVRSGRFTNLRFVFGILRRG